MIDHVIAVAGYPYHTTYQKNTSSPDKWLLLHGFMGSRHDFDTILSALPGEVLVIDLLGFGAKAPLVQPATRFAMRNQMTDLKAILAAYQWEKVNLLGYSMGGRLALGFAIAQPEQVASLVLESTTAGIVDATERAARRTADAQKAQHVRQDFQSFVNHWEKLPLFASQQQLSSQQQQQMRTQRLEQIPENVANSLIGMGTGTQPNFWPNLAQLSIKTTLIVGERDLKFNQIADKMVQVLPNATKVVIAGAGHNTHFEQPDQVIARLLTHVSH